MFKWLLAMVSSWGWIAGYTGKTVDHSYIAALHKCVFMPAGLYVNVLWGKTCTHLFSKTGGVAP